MKYMGSKRVMLENGLGSLLRRELKTRRRFVDLFCGGASVAWFAAEVGDVPVLAVDLQRYATTLADSVILREKPADAADLKRRVLELGRQRAMSHPLWDEAVSLERCKDNIEDWASRSIKLCAAKGPAVGAIWKSYGGFYFSSVQALALDSLLSVLPHDRAELALCLAAIIVGASRCAAAPGHTAQPFKANTNAAPFLKECWERDIFQYVGRAIEAISAKSAQRKGKSRTVDALLGAKSLRESDLVFVDPPYSGVHYSRFYHVLETIARGTCGNVSGAGRYPPPSERPVSAFSRKGESTIALSKLLKSLSDSGCRSIVTFPSGDCSNGLSGKVVLELAAVTHRIRSRRVKSRFSTLGGNNRHRHARKVSDELILVLDPR